MRAAIPCVAYSALPRGGAVKLEQVFLTTFDTLELHMRGEYTKEDFLGK